MRQTSSWWWSLSRSCFQSSPRTIRTWCLYFNIFAASAVQNIHLGVSASQCRSNNNNNNTSITMLLEHSVYIGAICNKHIIHARDMKLELLQFYILKKLLKHTHKNSSSEDSFFFFWDSLYFSYKTLSSSVIFFLYLHRRNKAWTSLPCDLCYLYI